MKINRTLASPTLRFTTSSALAIALGLSATAVSAAAPSGSDVVDASTSGARSADDGDIVVTARHRTERLQDVPISAQVVQGAELGHRNLNDMATLGQTLPNVHFGQGARSNDLYIRGTGSGSNQSFDQSVGIFIDDVYHGRSRMTAATFLDLSRVEVLRGPQSTYFGNNAIAGAVNIITQKPGSVWEGNARALYGQFGQYALEAAVGGPVTEKIGIRAAVIASGQNGWIEDAGLGQHVPRERNISGRLTIVVKPTEDWDITGKVEVGRNRSNTYIPLQIEHCPPPAPIPTGNFCGIALAAGTPIGIDNNNRSTTPGSTKDQDNREYHLTSNYDFNGTTLTSVTGYYSYDYLQHVDSDNQLAALSHVTVPEKYHQFSQELRVSSPTGKVFEYMAGLYYQSDRFRYEQINNQFFLNSTINNSAALAALRTYLPLSQRLLFVQREKVYSAFGTVTVRPLPRLSLSAGLRQSWTNKSYDLGISYGTASQTYGGFVPYPDPSLNAVASASGLGIAGQLSGSRSDKALMPSARIQYEFNPRIMAYASYNRGFKAGGFNGGDTSGLAERVPFSPEHVDAYEIGLKTELFNRTLTANVALFKSDYTGLQFASSLFSPAGTLFSIVQNVGQSVSKGIETELRWTPSRAFRIVAAGSYNDSHYIRNPNVSPTVAQTLAYNQCRAANAGNLEVCNPLATQDLSGRPTQFAPKWTGTLTASYTFGLSHNLQLETHVTGNYSSSYFASAVDDDLAKQSAYARIDAGFTLETIDGRWALDVIGKNLTNRNIIQYAVQLPSSLGTFSVANAQPRNVAAQVRYRF